MLELIKNVISTNQQLFYSKFFMSRFNFADSILCKVNRWIILVKIKSIASFSNYKSSIKPVKICNRFYLETCSYDAVWCEIIIRVTISKFSILFQAKEEYLGRVTPQLKQNYFPVILMNEMLGTINGKWRVTGKFSSHKYI